MTINTIWVVKIFSKNPEHSYVLLFESEQDARDEMYEQIKMIKMQDAMESPKDGWERDLSCVISISQQNLIRGDL